MVSEDRLIRAEKSIDPEAVSVLPTLEKNILDWIKYSRPKIGNRDRDFRLEPFWPQVYLDNHPNKCIVCGRQTFKTTYCTDRCAHCATTNAGVEVTYVTDNDAHLSAFSRQRLRRETFLANPILKQFLPYGSRAAVQQIDLENQTVIYLRTDEQEYRSVEGLSNI